MLDYDDLLLYWAHMLAEREFAAEIGARFDHILVDEYQDTNRLAGDASCWRSSRTGRGMTVVGDDAQSIYSFRAATVRNILDFPKHFTPQARIVTLEQNYRSTQPILAASNAVIALATERFTKNLWSAREASQRPLLVTVRDEAEQARYVVEPRAAKPRGRAAAEIAGRAVPHLASLRHAGIRADPPQHSVREVRRAEVPRSRAREGHAGGAALCGEPARPRRGLSRHAARARHRAGDRREACSIVSRRPIRPRCWSPTRRRVRAPNGRASRSCSTRCSAATSVWPAEFEQVRRWYEPHLERLHDDAPARAADLAQLEQIAAGYRTREQFLTDLTLDPPSATSDEAGAPLLDEDYLILSTIHSAKGQEWKSVFVLNAVDGCIPSDLATGNADEIEEERRLLYVAMTRAKDQLDVIVPQRFYTHNQAKNGDRYVHALRTRFITDAGRAAVRAAHVAAVRRQCRRGREGDDPDRRDGAHAGDVAVKGGW